MGKAEFIAPHFGGANKPTNGLDGEWHSIDTAPKDGTCVLVCCASGGLCMHVARWLEEYYLPQRFLFWHWWRRGMPAWLSIDTDLTPLEPTHWMHLPERP